MAYAMQISSTSSTIGSGLSGLQPRRDGKTATIWSPKLQPKRYGLLVTARKEAGAPRAGSDIPPADSGVPPASPPELWLPRRGLLAGGLAGALAAVDPVRAAPVGDPSMKTCGPATVDSWKGSIYVACCPPKPKRATIDFKPDSGPLRVRPAAHLIDEEYIAKYNLAYQKMRDLPADDPRSFFQQANVHCVYCNNGYRQEGDKNKLQIHFSWLFLPWHRFYLYFHEKILGSLIGDPTFALPFWNWDNQQGGSVIPDYFMREGTALYDVNRNLNNKAPALVKLAAVPGQPGVPDDPQVIKNSNLNVMRVNVANVKDQVTFFGGYYRKGDAAGGNDGSVEKTPHTAVHIFGGNPDNPFGEDLGNFYSAGRDPLFYCHHSNVDRMWNVWRSLGNSDFTDTDYLETEFLFFDENQDLVKCKVKDSLDAEGKMKYKFESAPDDQWINYVPPRGNPARTASLVPENMAMAAEYKELGPAASNSSPVTVTTKPMVVTVKQPKDSAGKADEILVLENVTLGTDNNTNFEVFIDFPQADDTTTLDCTEYVGSFFNIPHFMPGMSGAEMTRSTNARFSIKKSVSALNLANADNLTVTIVPKGKDKERGFTIQGASIVHT